MDKRILTEEQKNEIINMVLNTRMTYKVIARNNNIDAIQLNQIIDAYCRKNNYKSFRRTEKGVIFEKQDGTILENERIEQKKTPKKARKKERKKTVKNAQDIEKWANENKRRPRSIIKGVKTAKKGKKETKEQEEIRLGIALNNIRRIAYKYKGKELEKIEDEKDREIVRIYRELNEKYKDTRKAKEKILKNMQDIEKWANENKRRPRSIIKGVELVREGKEKTKDEKELRMGKNLNNARRILNKYEGKELEGIEDEDDRKIVAVVRSINSKYEKNKTGKRKISERKINLVQTMGNEKMGKMIINLIKTKNATEEQVKKIAEFYGVELGKIENTKEGR